MSNIDERQSIMEEFFAMGGNSNPDARIAVQKRITAYLRENKDDAQIKDLNTICKIYRTSIELNDRDRCHELSQPIFKRLDDDNIVWDIIDIRILISAMAANLDYKRTIRLSLRVTEELNKHVNYIHYNYMRMGMHMNISLILCELKSLNRVPEEELKDLEYAFADTMNEVEEIYKTYQHPYVKPYILVRKGIFFDKKDLQQKGLELAKFLDNKQIYKLLKSEIDEVEVRETTGYSTSEYRRIIGLKLKSLRKRYGLTVDKLAKKTGLSAPLISAVERGSRNLTSLKKRRVIKRLKCSPQELEISDNETKSKARDDYDILYDLGTAKFASYDKAQMKKIIFIMHALDDGTAEDFCDKLIAKILKDDN